MSDLDAKLYALFALCELGKLPIVFCACETAKWELVALLRKQLKRAANGQELQGE